MQAGSIAWQNAIKRDAVNRTGLITATIIKDSALLLALLKDSLPEVRKAGLQVINQMPEPAEFWRDWTFSLAEKDPDPIVRSTAIAVGQIQSPDTFAVRIFGLSANESHPNPLHAILSWHHQLSDTNRALSLADRLKETHHSFLLLEALMTIADLGDSSHAEEMLSASKWLNDYDVTLFIPRFAEYALRTTHGKNFENVLDALLTLQSDRGSNNSFGILSQIFGQYAREHKKIKSEAGKWKAVTAITPDRMVPQ